MSMKKILRSTCTRSTLLYSDPLEEKVCGRGSVVAYYRYYYFETAFVNIIVGVFDMISSYNSS
jgi:hypothetical protein